MAKMKWTKPSAETVAYFERIAPGPPIQVRRMFGMPARFLNGHMLVGVFGNTFMLHLSAADREACIRAGAKPFAPMGREAREYVDIPPGTFDDRTLKEWIVRGMRYLGSLPPKLKAKPAKPAHGESNGTARRASTTAAGPSRGVAAGRTKSKAKAPAKSAAKSKTKPPAKSTAKSKTKPRAKGAMKSGSTSASNGTPAKAKKSKTVAKKSKKRRGV
jgi:TfoX/Sxy family transcriptional regulator of competence genes